MRRSVRTRVDHQTDPRERGPAAPRISSSPRPSIGTSMTDVTEALQRDQILNEHFDQRRGLQSQLSSKHVATYLILPDRLARIALSQVCLDQSAVRALAQGLAAHSSHSGHHSLRMLAGTRPALAESFQRVQSNLTMALSLDHYPVFVPARQQLARERQRVNRQALDIASRVDGLPGDLFCLVNIHDYSRTEAQTVARRTDKIDLQQPEPP